MKERFKQIRKSVKLTQKEFAEALSLSQNYIAQIEIGKKIPSDRTISDVCRVFKVNEEWLRTGEGEIESLSDDDFSRICGEIGATDDRLKKIIIELWKMPESDRDLLWDFAEKLYNAIKE